MRKILNTSLALSFAFLSLSVNSTLIDGIKPKNQADFAQQSPQLNEPVNINFKDTNLSNILLLLAKVADLNLIFPQELDTKVTIQLKDRPVHYAISDLIEISKLKYKLEKNTLSVFKDDTNAAHNETVTIIYSDASEISKILNETLFKQLIDSQPPEAPKPFASIIPSKNIVLISGNDDQLRSAKDYIKKLDKKPEVDYYTTSFIDPLDAQAVITSVLPFSSVETKVSDRALFLRGNKEEIKNAINLLKDFDKPQAAVKVKAELYSIPKKAIKQVNSLIPLNTIAKLSEDFHKSLDFQSILINTNKLQDKDFSASKNADEDLRAEYGFDIAVSQNVLQPNQYDVFIGNQKLRHINKGDYAVLKLKAKEQNKLKSQYELKKDSEILLVLKVLG